MRGELIDRARRANDLASYPTVSEGERKFSLREASRYTLLVVVGIDLRNGIHASIVRRGGEVGGADVELETAQWRGRLLAK